MQRFGGGRDRMWRRRQHADTDADADADADADTDTDTIGGDYRIRRFLDRNRLG
jgi:hypothetical protein